MTIYDYLFDAIIAIKCIISASIIILKIDLARYLQLVNQLLHLFSLGRVIVPIGINRLVLTTLIMITPFILFTFCCILIDGTDLILV